ncbi:very short patch repair endonuclease [Dyella sp. RRB7]|uniref:very short patch repair endonuclease n=1 Tax=Dyella sp. RRB7 TaxID=2919502 RepID=UPI0031B852DC
MDRLSSEQRSKHMSLIRSKDTKPERKVRSTLHALGYRFRLHNKELPGKPDLVFRARKKVIFVHGCFWHGHGCRGEHYNPKSNTEYWVAKIERNRQRDRQTAALLRRLGWGVATVWECQLRRENSWLRRIQRFLEH